MPMWLMWLLAALTLYVSACAFYGLGPLAPPHAHVEEVDPEWQRFLKAAHAELDEIDVTVWIPRLIAEFNKPKVATGQMVSKWTTRNEERSVKPHKQPAVKQVADMTEGEYEMYCFYLMKNEAAVRSALRRHNGPEPD